MKVKMLTSMAGMNFSWEPGRVVEVADYVGEAWDKAGIARPVKDEKSAAQEQEQETTPEPPQDAQETAKTEAEGNTPVEVQEVETAAPGGPNASPVDLDAITDKKEFMAKVLEIYGWNLDGRKSFKNLKVEVLQRLLINE